VKKAGNFPPYDLYPSSSLKNEVFTYYPISDIDAYKATLQDNGFKLCQSNDITNVYFYPSCNLMPYISVATDNASGGPFEATIMYRSNPSLLNAITPARVPLVQYQLTEFYVGERAPVINHIAQYKSDIVGLGFKEIDEGFDKGEMEKEVGNCVYQWFYQHYDNLPSVGKGSIDYNWIVYDKNS
jgi:hypothetical protein